MREDAKNRESRLCTQKAHTPKGQPAESICATVQSASVGKGGTEGRRRNRVDGATCVHSLRERRAGTQHTKNSRALPPVHPDHEVTLKLHGRAPLFRSQFVKRRGEKEGHTSLFDNQRIVTTDGLICVWEEATLSHRRFRWTSPASPGKWQTQNEEEDQLEDRPARANLR